MNKRQKKIITIFSLVAVLCFSLFLILYALRDNVIFFYSPSEVKIKVSNDEITNGSLIRLGGLVLENSFQRGEGKNVSFDFDCFPMVFIVFSVEGAFREDSEGFLLRFKKSIRKGGVASREESEGFLSRFELEIDRKGRAPREDTEGLRLRF